VRVAVQKIEGVQSAEVSLNQGLATVRFRPNNVVTIEQVRGAIRKNGFTPKAARVRVTGTLTDHQGQPALALPGTSTLYVLREGSGGAAQVADLRRLALGTRVTIEGEVPESPKAGVEPLPLLVASAMEP
jgi:copper chaperone CopZ